MIKDLLRISVLGVLVACSSVRPTTNASTTSPPAPPSAPTPTLTASERSAYQALYEAKCSTCHNLYSPEAYKPSDWKSLVTQMANMGNSKGGEMAISREEETAILQYLTEAAKAH